MPDFKKLLEEKNKRLVSIPEALQTAVEKQQKKILDEIIQLASELDTKGGEIIISAKNIKKIDSITEKLKEAFRSDEYVSAVKEFASEFDKQAFLNNKVIKAGFEDIVNPVASQLYIETAKKNTLNAFLGTPLDAALIAPLQSQLETAVISGASLGETIKGLTTFIEGNKDVDSKILRYVKQISNDSFAIADRSYTSILSDFLDAEWFYYSGSEQDTTRCFCKERYDKFFHYKEIESWGNGENLGECNIGGGKWAGEIEGTNSKTIFSYAGGYNCSHSISPVSEFIVPDSAKERARDLGYIK